MKKSLALILSFLTLICIASFIAGAYLNSAAAFGLSTVSLCLFVAIFAVEVLEYKIGGHQVTIEKRLGSLEKDNIELKEAVTSLLKSIYLLSHPNTPIGGPSQEMHQLIDKYLAPIKHLILEDVKVTVELDLNNIREHHLT